ncbi:metalloregulator ArsR/SmtB family transcription factor [Paenibacillus dokdonensis]|uniref:Metalloregulator ArsR/SmtB family transcription factor n=1 Tax=Paenibacillus dokdonensis TaxID=2567944 RepID=A0ABU6GJ37_9BACL|nr:metalloregulator ArsR/SmtB family transcription factor [Paenibacillus dokdonensis]MEC0239754.1 metalloregulator ArsR/SmtB family transcription factor [Paenibacillus dokdonensis]
MESKSGMRDALKVYKALGEPTRINIVLLLASEPDQCCVSLGEKLKNVANSTLSHHLKQLSECGLLQSRKEGTFIYYSLNRRVVEKYSPFLLT